MPDISRSTQSRPNQSPYTRSNPFPGKLVVNRRLSGLGI